MREEKKKNGRKECWLHKRSVECTVVIIAI